jgi:hypothetical protein
MFSDASVIDFLSFDGKCLKSWCRIKFQLRQGSQPGIGNAMDE